MITPYRSLVYFPFFLEGIAFRLNDVLSDMLFILFERFTTLPKVITEVYAQSFRLRSYLNNPLNPELHNLPSYITGTHHSLSISEQLEFILQENFESLRFNRSVNPVFKYDFKVGNYLPDESRKLNPHLFNTLKDITMGIRKSPWFSSEDYNNYLRFSFVSHLLYFNDFFFNESFRLPFIRTLSQLNASYQSNSPHHTNMIFTSGFYTFFHVLKSNSYLVNSR
jgi:hypothetical protein